MPTTFLCGKELPSATPVMMRATMPTDSIPHAKSWHLRHMPAAAFVSPTPLHFHRPFSSTQVAQTRLKGIFSSRRRRAICALNMNTGQVQDSGSKPSAAELPNVPTPPPEPSDSIPTSSRMFSNIEPAADGSLKRVPSSELACTALVGVCSHHFSSSSSSVFLPVRLVLTCISPVLSMYLSLVWGVSYPDVGYNDRLWHSGPSVCGDAIRFHPIFFLVARRLGIYGHNRTSYQRYGVANW